MHKRFLGEGALAPGTPTSTRRVARGLFWRNTQTQTHFSLPSSPDDNILDKPVDEDGFLPEKLRLQLREEQCRHHDSEEFEADRRADQQVLALALKRPGIGMCGELLFCKQKGGTAQ
jgi:hypothetical protein